MAEHECPICHNTWFDIELSGRYLMVCPGCNNVENTFTAEIDVVELECMDKFNAVKIELRRIKEG